MTAITADGQEGITAGLDALAPALVSLRLRLLDLATGLDAGAWAGPSRCHRWTAHDVLRHVRDACRLHVGGLRRDPYWPFDKPFDHRATPDEWLSLSTGQSPEETIDDLRHWSLDEAPALVERLEAADQDIVSGPYGPIPWTLLSAHVLWDGWLHDRDVSQVTGGGTPSGPVEEALVATYALFIASMAAMRFGLQPFERTVGLVQDGRRYLATVRPGHVELDSATSIQGADVQGPLAAVVDSLAGRGADPADVLTGGPEALAPLVCLRAVFAPTPPPG